MYLPPQKLVEHFDKCKTDRAMHENVWQRVADFIIPLQNDITRSSIDGESKFNNILDATAMNSCELLAGALHGMLTSPTQFFFYLSTGNPVWDQRDATRKWIQATVRKMHNLFNNSNFQTEVHEYYINLVGFGNGPMFVEEDVKDIVRFAARPVKEIFVKENSKGRIDVVYRDFKLNARGMYEEFGEKNLPDDVKMAYQNGKPTEFEVVQAIYPREVAQQQYDPSTSTSEERKQLEDMQNYGVSSKFPFISQYVLKSKKTNLMMKGYREFPAVYGRWTKVTGESYGRGCGEKALPDTLTLNEMTRVTLVGAQKVIDPPIQMPDDGFILPIATRSGGINYYRAGSPATDRMAPVFNDSRVDFGYQAIDRKQQSIRESFYVDQLQLRNGPQMTATEVQQRVEQSLRFLAPMLGRQQSEFLSPLVERVYAIMSRRGEIDPVPAELQNVSLKIMYSSVMAMTQRQSEMTNINRGLASVGALAQFDKSAIDVVDATSTARYVLGLNNFPQEGIRDQKDVDALRKQRAEMQQQMVDQQNQAQQAETAANMGKAAQATQQPA